MSSQFQFKSGLGASPPMASGFQMRVATSSSLSSTGISNGPSMAGSTVSSRIAPGSGAKRPASPLRVETPTPTKGDEEVAAWQFEVDSLEQKQVQIQADQMTLLFSQIHILTRELGDLQKQFVSFGEEMAQRVDMLGTDLQTAQDEAHSALRLELAEYGNHTSEMKAAWEEAHDALARAMDDGLGDAAAQHAAALENHRADHAAALASQAEIHGNRLSELEDLHNKRCEEHQRSLQAGLEDVHVNLQKELAELRSGHAVDLRKVVEDVANQVDSLTLNVEQMAKDIGAAQEEAHAALRFELAEHGNNAAEMKAAWQEAHIALSQAMDENLSNLAEQHAQALDAHKAEQAQALAEHGGNLGNLGGNLEDLESLHNKRYAEHSACLEKGLHDVRGSLQAELAELRSGHAVNLQAVVTDVTQQVEKLTADVEQMARDIAAAQEEAHAALRLELAAHGNNTAEMKAAWEEAHNALTQAMDDNLSALADEHAKALDDHKAEQSRALADHGGNLGNLGGSLAELEDLHNKRYAEHSASLEKGLDDVRGSLQAELAELRSGHAINLRAVVTDVTQQVEKLTADVEQMARDIATAQEEAHSALRLELAEHGTNAAEMQAAWEEAHHALAEGMDDNLSRLAEHNAKALEDHKAEHSKALEDHRGNLGDLGSNIAELEDLQLQRYEEHSANLVKGLDDVRVSLQAELEELRSGHAVNLRAVVTDVAQQVEKLTEDMEQLTKDVATAQDEAHSALRLEIAEHGNNVVEMQKAWEEAHRALSEVMDENLSNIAAEHAASVDQHRKDLAAHKEEHAQMLEAHAEMHGNTLTEMTELHNRRYEEHNVCLENAIGDVHSSLQKDLAEMRSGHAVNLKALVEDVTAQVDKLSQEMEVMAKDLVVAQEEAHSALRLELAEHGNNSLEMKAAWEEAHDALANCMDEGLAKVAADHASAQDSHNLSHSQRMDEMEKQISAQFERLHSNHDMLHDMHANGRLEHAEALEKGMEAVLENTHSRLQDELTELRSGHAANLRSILEDVTLQVDTLTLAMENAQVLRKANSEKLEQVFKAMEKAFTSVSFSGKAVKK